MCVEAAMGGLRQSARGAGKARLRRHHWNLKEVAPGGALSPAAVRRLPTRGTPEDAGNRASERMGLQQWECRPR